MLAELVGFQPHKIEPHEINPLVFAGRQNLRRLARVRAKVPAEHDAVIGAALLINRLGELRDLIPANARAALRLADKKRNSVANAVNSG